MAADATLLVIDNPELVAQLHEAEAEKLVADAELAHGLSARLAAPLDCRHKATPEHSLWHQRRRAGLIPRRPPADVAAAEATGPVDAVDGGVSAVAGGCKIATCGGDTKYAPAIGDQPLIVAARAGVK